MTGKRELEVAWQIEHSVEIGASRRFAWEFMTDVSNWDDPPARFRLEGPFEAGVRGSTEMPDQPTRHWQIREVKPFESYTIEHCLDRAVLLFEWRFSEVPSGGARLTQHIELAGENAATYVELVQQGFGTTLADGMKRIAVLIDKAYGERIAGKRGGAV